VRAAELLLSRLEGVRARGSDQWSARCPAHEDRSPSLSIRAVDDRVLLTCWAGCSALEVVQSVGLELRDLFERTLDVTPITPLRQPPFPLERCKRLRHLALVIGLAASDLKYGRPLTKSDEETLIGAFRELDDLVTEVETWPRSAVRA
jgi:hypothetical protein